jgi:two-component system response regulator GlrR
VVHGRAHQESESPVSPATGPHVLFVEDNEEIREALASVLEGEGYAVTAAESAEEGLAQLRARRFDLLLTDYSLPGETGAWLVARAREEGLLEGTEAMMVTAHPDPRGAEGLRIVRKPLDLDDFLRDVAALTAPARALAAQAAQAAGAGPGASPLPGSKAGSGALELRLYISSTSAASLRAVRSVQRTLRAYDPSAVRLTVCDLVEEQEGCEEDRIAFTPTLVKRGPGPRTWLVGGLDRSEALTELLSLSGVEPRA